MEANLLEERLLKIRRETELNRKYNLIEILQHLNGGKEGIGFIASMFFVMSRSKYNLSYRFFEHVGVREYIELKHEQTGYSWVLSNEAIV